MKTHELSELDCHARCLETLNISDVLNFCINFTASSSGLNL